MGPTQRPIRWGPKADYLRVTRPGREADHSPPSSAEVKNGGAVPPLLHMSSWHGAQMKTYSDNLTFTLNTEDSIRNV
jgi:hypothetical protein